MTTARALVTSALKKAGVTGVGQTAGAEDISDGLDDLNDLLAEWSRKRWLVWHLLDVGTVSTGAQSYSVGPGQDFDTPRPDRIEAAFVRYLQNGVQQADFPVTVLQAREDYNRISVKQVPGPPSVVFYDSAFPVGTLYFCPVPQAGRYELHVAVKDTLSAVTLDQAITTPPEYLSALRWNLARKLLASYKMPPDAGVESQAKNALNVIRMANTQIPKLRMPANLRRSTFNPVTGVAY